MEIIAEKYRIENDKLGTGGFSEVFLGMNLTTNEKVAVKKILLAQKNIIIKNLKVEIELMQRISHPNIVTYYDQSNNNTHWYIIMEYCNAGTLSDVIKYNEKASKSSLNFNRENNTYHYLNQLKDALNYIRSRGYIHRDIKPMNVLLTRAGKDYTSSFNESDMLFKTEVDLSSFDRTENLIVKLADFGLARHYVENEEVMMNTICGSPLYMAPELLFGEKYNSKADLWSYGVIMYELLFGSNPNAANSLPQLKKNLQSKNINFNLNKNFTPYCFDLMTRLLNKTPGLRLDWDKFFNHKWFSYWKENDGQEYISDFQKPEPSQQPEHIEPVSSSLGRSNLSKMNFTSFSNIYRGAYSEYPSSYPPSRSQHDSSCQMPVSRSVEPTHTMQTSHSRIFQHIPQ